MISAPDPGAVTTSTSWEWGRQRRRGHSQDRPAACSGTWAGVRAGQAPPHGHRMCISAHGPQMPRCLALPSRPTPAHAGSCADEHVSLLVSFVPEERPYLGVTQDGVVEQDAAGPDKGSKGDAQEGGGGGSRMMT